MLANIGSVQNCYDNAMDGNLFRNNQVGVLSRAGIFYLRNSRFENSSVCDIVAGACAHNRTL